MCNAEAPSVEAAYQRWRDTAYFVGVAWAGDDEDFHRFVTLHGLTFPTLSDDAGAVFSRFGVPVQPAVVIVGTDGTVQRTLGAVDESALDEMLTAASG